MIEVEKKKTTKIGEFVWGEYVETNEKKKQKKLYRLTNSHFFISNTNISEKWATKG